jgi:hypothetical protein
MLKKPFVKGLEELLEDQIDNIDFEKISVKYAANVSRTNEIFAILESCKRQYKTYQKR